MKTPKGIILYEGPSLLNNRHVVLIATGIKSKSLNQKTGEMIQTWILVKNTSPLEAVNCGKDKAICGNCKLRKFRCCYVNLCHGPKNIWDAYKAKQYVKFDSSMIDYFRGRDIRFGSYGDPAAVPVNIWNALAWVASSHTGYTHQWRTCNTELKNLCMASVDTEKEYYKAFAAGWHTFRTRLNTDRLLQNEFICPASKEGGNKTDCIHCGACRGVSDMTKTPCIVAHGPSWKTAYYRRCIIRYRNKKGWKDRIKSIPAPAARVQKNHLDMAEIGG